LKGYIIIYMQPIGIFDSGFGGLSIFKAITAVLPQYDFIYLGDNARAPYGNRSFETVYEYTLQNVKWFFEQDCPLVILACNTASAKALRTIQKNDLPHLDPAKRVLGVIRPTAEVVGTLSKTNAIGIMGTTGTITSNSYPIEINHFAPQVNVYQQACPMLVPLIENGEHHTTGAAYYIELYVKALLSQNDQIDTILLACTHYPLIEDVIRKFTPAHIKLVSQGALVAHSLQTYLSNHPEIECKISKNGNQLFYTTDDTQSFENAGSIFLGRTFQALHVDTSKY
jgi:glutamate racemase